METDNKLRHHHAIKNTRKTSPALRRLIEENAIGQLRRQEGLMATLGSENGALKLDWVEGVARLLEDPTKLEQVETEAREIWERGIHHIIWAGMGGSVIAVRVFIDLGFCSDQQKGIVIYPLDSTDPAALNEVVRQIARAKNQALPNSQQPADATFLRSLLDDVLMIGVSMGMTSEEPITHLTWFSDLLEQAQLSAAEHLLIMTLPGSYLDDFAHEHSAPTLPLQPDGRTGTGGRMSAPTTRVFLLPVALYFTSTSQSSGHLQIMLRRAWQEYNLALTTEQPASSSFVRLAASLSDASIDGACRLLLNMPQAWQPLIPWIEQLMEESLGKGSKGIIVFNNQTMDSNTSPSFALTADKSTSSQPPQNTPPSRRGRFIAPTADLSAPSQPPQNTPPSRRGRFIAPTASAQRSGARFNPSAPNPNGTLLVKVTTDSQESEEDNTFTLHQPSLASNEPQDRLAALTASFLGWQLTMALYGYLQHITFAGQPAVENYKARARTLRKYDDPLKVVLKWRATTKHGPLTLLAPQTGGTSPSESSPASMFASTLQQMFTTNETTLRLGYLDFTMNGELLPSIVSVLYTHLHTIGDDILGVPVKLRPAPAAYHSTEQSEMDGPPYLLSLRILARNHEKSILGTYTDTFLRAQAVSTWQAMLEQGRPCFLLIIDGSPTEALDPLERLFEDVARYLRGNP